MTQSLPLRKAQKPRRRLVLQVCTNNGVRGINAAGDKPEAGEHGYLCLIKIEWILGGDGEQAVFQSVLAVSADNFKRIPEADGLRH